MLYQFLKKPYISSDSSKMVDI